MTDTPQTARYVLALRLECSCGAMRVRHAPPTAWPGWDGRIITQAAADGWAIGRTVRCPACARTKREDTP